MRKYLVYLFTFLFLYQQPLKAQESIFQKNKQWIAPLALTGMGLVLYNESTKTAQLEFRNNHLSHFQTSADDFLQYTPSLLFLGANWADKINGNNKDTFKEKLSIFLIGTGTYVVISQILKKEESMKQGQTAAIIRSHLVIPAQPFLGQEWLI